MDIFCLFIFLYSCIYVYNYFSYVFGGVDLFCFGGSFVQAWDKDPPFRNVGKSLGFQSKFHFGWEKNPGLNAKPCLSSCFEGENSPPFLAHVSTKRWQQNRSFLGR